MRGLLMSSGYYQPNQRIQPMRGSAFMLVLYSVACGALPLMADPQRSA